MIPLRIEIHHREARVIDTVRLSCLASASVTARVNHRGSDTLRVPVFLNAWQPLSDGLACADVHWHGKATDVLTIFR